MVVTKHFVFLHLHKSGGSFVNKALLTFLPDAVKIGHHTPGSLIPAHCRHLPVLGVVRSPWEYYVSWFAFQSTRREYVWRVFSNDGQRGFAETTERMLRAGEDDGLLDQLIELAPTEFPNRKVNLTKACIATYRGAAWGWYTFLYRRMYGDLPVHFLRQESLREDLLDYLSRRGVASPELTEFIRSAPRVNGTEHDHYRSYYPERLAKVVAERDRLVVDRFGYVF